MLLTNSIKKSASPLNIEQYEGKNGRPRVNCWFSVKFPFMCIMASVFQTAILCTNFATAIWSNLGFKQIEIESELSTLFPHCFENYLPDHGNLLYISMGEKKTCVIMQRTCFFINATSTTSGRCIILIHVIQQYPCSTCPVVRYVHQNTFNNYHNILSLDLFIGLFYNHNVFLMSWSWVPSFCRSWPQRWQSASRTALCAWHGQSSSFSSPGGQPAQQKGSLSKMHKSSVTW